MRRIFITLICWTALIAPLAEAGTFPLTDGTKIVGSPESINDNGVVFQLESGDYSPRLTWDKFTPEALKELIAEAKKESERALLEPMAQSLPQEVAKRQEIVIKPIQTPERPKYGGGIIALFSSPVGWLLMVVLYGANLFAAYEVCIYRHQPPGRVCGLAAIPFFGVLSPIIYGSMPTQVPPPEILASAPPHEAAATASEATTAPGTPAPAASYAASAATGAVTREATTPAAAPAPVLPEPVIFQRGEFSFNRRFFETKFAGFFRVIPSEAEKDLVLVFKAARGQFVGRRISRITPNELALEVVKNNVSAEEVIPFSEVAEVQIRHKDTV